MGKLVLLKPHKDLAPFQAGVLYEVAAAKYVKIDIATFRELVRSGMIPARRHPGRTRWIYLKEDLDTYLRNLPTVDASRGKIGAGEVPSDPPSFKEESNGR